MVRRGRGFFISARILIALPLLLALGTLGCGRSTTSRATTTYSQLKLAEAVLHDLARIPADAIPDAVLNHTQCLLIFPSGAGEQEGFDGVGTCRLAAQEWGSPAALLFTSHRPLPGADLLVFLLSSSAPDALKNGGLDLRSVAPGPLVRVSSIIAPLELRSDAVAYVRHGSELKGASISGRIRVEPGQQWWEQQARQYSTELASFFNMIVPTGIIIHHTATIPGEGKVPTSEREIDEYHQARGFDELCFGREYHVAYHYLVLPDGTIQQGRPDRCQGAHAPGYNSYLGISVAGDFSSADNPRGTKGLAKPTARQIKSVIELCRRLRKQYNIPVQHILRHSDVAPTQCPGDRFPFREVVSQVARLQ